MADATLARNQGIRKMLIRELEWCAYSRAGVRCPVGVAVLVGVLIFRF